MTNLKKIAYKYRKLIISVLFLMIFLFMLTEVLEKETISIDNYFYRFIIAIRSDGLTSFMKIITKFSNVSTLTIITALLLILFYKYKESILIPINLGIIALLNFILKNIVARPRPMGYRLINESGYSFPSGHAMVSMSFYGFLIYLVYKKMPSKLKIPIMILLFCLIIMIGFSRVYLGVHYITDVIAGFSVSIVYVIVFIEFIYKKVVGEKNV